VDDEQRVASTLALILNRSGFHATAFSDPLRALEATKKLKPDFLATDVQMSTMSGIELAVRYKELCPSGKALLFTGMVDTDSLRRMVQARGFNFEVLSKPIRSHDLVAKLLTF
jgi:twitching motility two-component system response regulator PilG